MKTFFGGLFIEKEKLEKAGIYHPIKLEYYKNTNEKGTDKKSRYGISIVKTEYIEKMPHIETKDIEYVTNDERKVDNILRMFKENQVTPINSEEVIWDLLRI